jgi:hypothetical protein
MKIGEAHRTVRAANRRCETIEPPLLAMVGKLTFAYEIIAIFWLNINIFRHIKLIAYIPLRSLCLCSLKGTQDREFF